MPRLSIGYDSWIILGALAEPRSAVLSVGDVGVANQVTSLQLYRLRCGAMIFHRCGSGRINATVEVDVVMCLTSNDTSKVDI